MILVVDHRNDHLEHHGILGQKWGIRRYQNEDGSLTEAGLKRLESGKGMTIEKGMKDTSKNQSAAKALVAQYKKDHPDTKLSDKQIAYNYGLEL